MNAQDIRELEMELGRKKTQPGKMSLGGPFTRAVSGPAREVMKAPQRRRLVFDGNKSDVAGI